MSFNSYNFIDGNAARKVEESYSNVVYVQPKRVANIAPTHNRPAERLSRSYAPRSSQNSGTRAAASRVSQNSPRTRTNNRVSNNAIVTNWNIPTNLQLLGMALALSTMMFGTVFLGA